MTDFETGLLSPAHAEVRSFRPPQAIVAALSRPATRHDVLPRPSLEELEALVYGRGELGDVRSGAARCLMNELGERRAAFFVVPTSSGGLLCSISGLFSWILEPFDGCLDWRVRYEGTASEGYTVTVFGIAAEGVTAVSLDTDNGREDATCESSVFFYECSSAQVEPLPVRGLYAVTKAGEQYIALT